VVLHQLIGSQIAVQIGRALEPVVEEAICLLPILNKNHNFREYQLDRFLKVDLTIITTTARDFIVVSSKQSLID